MALTTSSKAASRPRSASIVVSALPDVPTIASLLADAHCHPQDDPASSLLTLRAQAAALMGVHEGDWADVERLLKESPNKVVACMHAHCPCVRF